MGRGARCWHNPRHLGIHGARLYEIRSAIELLPGAIVAGDMSEDQKNELSRDSNANLSL